MNRTSEIDRRYSEVISLVTCTRGLQEKLALAKRDFRKRDTEVAGMSGRIMSEIRASVDIILSSKRYKKLRDLRKTMRGRRALLLGNGPSCEMINWDSELLDEKELDIAVVNFFVSPPDKLNHKIKQICITDPLVFNDGRSGDSLPYLEEKQSRLLERIKKLESPFLFCNRVVERQVAQLKKVNVSPVRFSDYSSCIFGGTNPAYPRSYMSMNIIKMITILDFLGYEEILLCGADNDFIKKIVILPDNSIATEQTYNNENSTLDPLTMHPVQYYKVITALEEAWHKTKGMRVLNLDPLSLTTAFRKVRPGDKYYGLLVKEYQERIEELAGILSW